jgi:anhydro-N-acetylmuramic acid kinase
MTQRQLYIGLMSGTSADAIDAALVEFQPYPHLITHYSLPFSSQIKQQIHALSLPDANEIDRMGFLDVELGKLFAQASIELIAKSGISKAEVIAIGSHGQTIRHRPPGSSQGVFSLQIGDPNVIVERVGITTVADFRRRDIAAGGQGAPLVPAFHQAVFQTQTKDRVILNIGGMANISWLPAQGQTLGFDTGPGNVLMDMWALQHLGTPYDENGAWAAKGKVDANLLRNMLADPFFAMPPPKSTGRESFNLLWLNECTKKPQSTLTAVDMQTTLLELTVTSIADSINKLSPTHKEILICGGGAYNSQLIQRLQMLLPNDAVATTSAVGIDPQWIEAMAFAWLAQQTINHRPGNLCAVTGANREVILGGVYHA